jgi:hypothetical protein
MVFPAEQSPVIASVGLLSHRGWGNRCEMANTAPQAVEIVVSNAQPPSSAALIAPDGNRIQFH